MEKFHFVFVHADDSVGGVVVVTVERHLHGLRAQRQPLFLGFGVNLEDVSLYSQSGNFAGGMNKRSKKLF